MLTSLLDGRIMAERHGRGQPSIVALHGWGRDASDWNRVLRGHAALALSLPGFGTTPVPEAPWGSPEYADVTLSAIDGVVAAPFTLVGHSFGGRVAAQIAARRPELVAGLILTGVPLFRRTMPTKPPLAFRAAKALNRLNAVSDATMDRMRQRYGSADYRAASGVMRQVFVKVVNEDYQSVVSMIAKSEIPVSLVWGEHDHDVPISVANRIHETIQNSTLRIVPGAGHLINDPLADALTSAIAISATTAHN